MLLLVAVAVVDLKQASQVTVTVALEVYLEQEPLVVIQAAVQVIRELEQVEQENLQEVLMLLLAVAVAEVGAEAEADNGLVKMVSLAAVAVEDLATLLLQH